MQTRNQSSRPGIWAKFCLTFAGLSPLGRMAMRLASWGYPPYYGRLALAGARRECFYIDPGAQLYHPGLSVGNRAFIDDRVLVYCDEGGGAVEIGDSARLYRDTLIQTGQGGSVALGPHVRVQAGCFLSAYHGRLTIGEGTGLAPQCRIYTYNHQILQGTPIIEQPLTSKGGVVIGSYAWIGAGVTIMDGVRIGDGAVVGAGAVVTRDVAPDSIVAGIPAKFIKKREKADEIEPT